MTLASALDYPFPGVTQVDLAFSTFAAPKELLDLASRRGFLNGNTAANDAFIAWFSGDLILTPDFKPNVDQAKAQRAMNWAVCFMRSYAPRHEEKEAVCALIFDEALDLTDLDIRRRPKL